MFVTGIVIFPISNMSLFSITLGEERFVNSLTAISSLYGSLMKPQSLNTDVETLNSSNAFDEWAGMQITVFSLYSMDRPFSAATVYELEA